MASRLQCSVARIWSVCGPPVTWGVAGCVGTAREAGSGSNTVATSRGALKNLHAVRRWRSRFLDGAAANSRPANAYPGLTLRSRTSGSLPEPSPETQLPSRTPNRHAREMMPTGPLEDRLGRECPRPDASELVQPTPRSALEDVLLSRRTEIERDRPLQISTCPRIVRRPASVRTSRSSRPRSPAVTWSAAWNPSVALTQNRLLVRGPRLEVSAGSRASQGAVVGGTGAASATRR